MNNAYLLIGGNMGDRMALLSSANKHIQQRCGEIVRASSIYSTAAWGKTEQPDFYNQCLHLQTEMKPASLMEELLEIEKELGRVRSEKMGPRLIDIDILLFNDEIIDTPELELPHPRLHLRRFALIPLAEIAATKMHPVFHKTVFQLLAECTDTLDVHKI